MSPFTISAQATILHADAAPFRKQFDQKSHLLFANPFEPAFLAKLMERAAASPFADDYVDHLGWRAVEAQQIVSAAISLFVGRFELLQWLEAATGLTPLRAATGRLVQTCANGRDALSWHDDLNEPGRMLGLVINLSDQAFGGGAFEMRHKGEVAPFYCVKHEQPGAMMVFPVNEKLEHRVTPVTAGGPRRVFAGWLLSQPEHENDPLARRSGS